MRAGKEPSGARRQSFSVFTVFPVQERGERSEVADRNPSGRTHQVLKVRIRPPSLPPVHPLRWRPNADMTVVGLRDALPPPPLAHGRQHGGQRPRRDWEPGSAPQRLTHPDPGGLRGRSERASGGLPGVGLRWPPGQLTPAWSTAPTHPHIPSPRRRLRPGASPVGHARLAALRPPTS